MESPVVVSEQVPADTKKPEQKKPELDWFLLRRGKAHVAQTERAPRTERAERPERREFTKPDKPAFPAERYAPQRSKIR
jgi:hypothetical protein